MKLTETQRYLNLGGMCVSINASFSIRIVFKAAVTVLPSLGQTHELFHRKTLSYTGSKIQGKSVHNQQENI